MSENVNTKQAIELPESRIPLSGGFRTQILETLFQLKRTQARNQQLMAEMEQIAQSAASFIGVDLKDFVLDVDTLDFIPRPTQQVAPPEAQAVTPTPEEVTAPSE